MKLILYFASLTLLLATTGCVVPVRERTYVRYQEHPHHYHHHWEHKGYPDHHYSYYEWR
jgi:hypothetical protein